VLHSRDTTFAPQHLVLALDLGCVCAFLHPFHLSTNGPGCPGWANEAFRMLLICEVASESGYTGARRAQVGITIPRWMQLVLIPIAILVALYFARSASHAVFIFLISTIVALLLNPVALGMHRVKFPRWLAVPVVYLAFLAVVVLFFVFLGPPLIRQFQRLFSSIPGWLDSLNRLLGDLEVWLASHNIDVNLQFDTSDIVKWLQTHGAQSIGTLITVGWSLVGMIINLVLTVVVSFYMLIDGKRIFRFLCRLAPGEPRVKDNYVRGLQSAFSRFVRGQILLGATIGLASGLAIWILSWKLVNVWPEGGQYALLFGFWAGITEVIPYIGPSLGAVPPVIAAFFHSPVTALWIIIVYFVIQQLESHILAPNIVGSSLGVHPLIVIFALLAGAEIGGIVGMIASLPLLALVRHTVTFYEFKMSRAPWAGDDGIVLIPARSGAPPPRRVRPPGVPDESPESADIPSQPWNQPATESADTLDRPRKEPTTD
jgi:predicted PurR-regulated permease PerM